MLAAHRLCLLLLLLALLAGCRSERVAFQFQPIPGEGVSSTVAPPQRDGLPLADSIQIWRANNSSHIPASSCPTARKVAQSQRQHAATTATTRSPSTKKMLRITHQNITGKPQHIASDGNAEFFAVLLGVVGLVMVLFGVVTWLGIVLLVVALLFSIGSIFSGKIGG